MDGDTIQLTADITDAGEPYDASAYDSLVDAVSSATLGMATINKAVTIDGDGHSITAGTDMAYCFNISGSGVVMKNLTIDGASYGARMGGGLYLAEPTAPPCRPPWRWRMSPSKTVSPIRTPCPATAAVPSTARAPSP